MKVILLENVANLGDMGDTVNVKDGYARNFLIPRNLALPATDRNLKQQQHNLRDIEKKRSVEAEKARGIAEKLSSMNLVFSRKAGETGRLFGSVTNMDIAESAAEKGVAIDRKDILLPEPIKNLGEFEVSIKLHSEVTTDIRITVLPEEGSIPEKAMEEVTEDAASPEEAPEEEKVEGEE